MNQAGGIYCEQSNCTMTAVNFTNNRVEGLGGAMSHQLANVYCTDCTLTGNTITAVGSNLTFAGTTMITKNLNFKPASPGALLAYMSSVTFTGHTLFKENYANGVNGGGGAVKVMFRSKLKFSGVTVFSNNSATIGGGAILVAVQVELEMTGKCDISKQ